MLNSKALPYEIHFARTVPMISHRLLGTWCRLLVSFAVLLVISAFLLVSSCCTGDFAPFIREFCCFTRDFLLYW
ncbi:hypothetical protein JMN23_05365 [Bacillus sp. RHFB]|nr:hypothetical protein [Bacillus sp. RHFB]